MYMYICVCIYIYIYMHTHRCASPPSSRGGTGGGEIPEAGRRIENPKFLALRWAIPKAGRWPPPGQVGFVRCLLCRLRKNREFKDVVFDNNSYVTIYYCKMYYDDDSYCW